MGFGAAGSLGLLFSKSLWCICVGEVCFLIPVGCFSWAGGI